jgi:hypothetical protein
LIVICRDLLTWSGRHEVDRTLGKLLRVLLRQDMIAEIEDVAFTVSRLAVGWNTENASAAYLNWKYRQAFGAERAPDIAQAEDFIAAAEALWPHLDEPTRLLYGLYVKLVTAHAALGNVDSLDKLSERLLAGPLTDERQQTTLLRIIKQMQRLRGTAQVESLLKQLLARDASVLCDPRLVNALLRGAAFDQLHTLVPHLVGKIEDLGVRSALLSILEQLLRYQMIGDGGQDIARVYHKDPGDPRAALLFGRYLAEQGAADTEIEAVFERLRQEDPHYDETVLWLAGHYFHLVQYGKLLQWLNSHPLHDPEKARWLMSRVHAASERQPFPDTANEGDGDRITLKALGPFGGILSPLVRVINGDLSPAADPPLSELCKDLQDVQFAVTIALESSTDVALSDSINAARELLGVSGKFSYIAAEGLRRKNLDLTHWGGPQHERVCAISETLYRVAMQLSKHVIEGGLKDFPISDIRTLCQAAEIYLCSSFAVGEPGASDVLLQALHARHIATPLILQLLERSALQRGDLQTARQLVAGQAKNTGEIFGIEPFYSWVQMEARQAHVLLEQEPRKSTFEYINPKGTQHTAYHEVPGTRVELVKVPGLRIRDIELLIGPAGTLLMPHFSHGRDLYGYPRKSLIRLNYGRRGCRLEPPKERLLVHEPVVALANMDGPYWCNYYHWMLFILTRVALLLDHGELKHRRLLLPMELSDWMMTSLELIGLPKERMLRYTASQEVVADEAWVVSSVEWAAAALMKRLQQRLWGAAVIDLNGISTRAVWLSRRQEPQRYLANTNAIEALAHHLGFDVVNPGTLSLLDQVRLCAEARIIAGPEGSNFTNLLFARPGTRVLTLMVAGGGGDYETWLDMCVMGDLQQQWIFGREDPRRAWWRFHEEPYEIEMTVLERELRKLVAT